MSESYPGRYRIIQKIGTGGLGEVYRADDTVLRRPVALKILSDTGNPERTRARLLREARSASGLNHPHICTIYEVGEHEGRAFIAMEWIDGPSLEAAIPAAGLPAGTVVRYGAEIADAMAHAHNRGIVHRDLKASNVVLTEEGGTKIVDFGLSVQVAIDEADTLSHSADSIVGLAGTPAYMAPELFANADASVTTDVWSLGVLLYRMACGKLPFRARSGPALLGAITSQAPEPMGGALTPTVVRIIERCLSKDPARRYQSAVEVRAALELAQTTLVASPKSRAATAKPVRRGRKGRIKSLAVLPLESIAQEEGQEYFVDGMTEALTTALARLGSIKVISRASAMRFRGTEKTIPEIARDLNVDGIVQGSVLRAGERVRVTAQLIHAETDQHVWANSYDGDLGDVLALHSHVAHAIAEEIRMKVVGRKSRPIPARVDPRAQDAYLRGRYHWSRRTADDLGRALECFNEAIGIAPDYAPPYVGLADYYSRLASNHLAAPETTFPRARASAVRALELDPELGEAQGALGTVLYGWDWKWTDAERAFARALELNPSYAEAQKERALLFAFTGREEEAREAMRHARELDPFSTLMIGSDGLVAFFMRQYGRAIELMSRALEEFSRPVPVPLAHIALSHAQVGDLDQADRTLRKGLQDLPGDATLLGALGYVHGIAGRRQEARTILEELRRLEAIRYVSPVMVAGVLTAIGDNDEAIACLEGGCEAHAFMMVTLRVNPMFDEIRTDSRFLEILRRMGFSSSGPPDRRGL